MWIISDIGFFNIIQYPEDKTKGILTVKARRKQDLLSLQAFTGPSEIEASDAADYPFRMKLSQSHIAVAFGALIHKIGYPKTKARLAETHPDRTETYFEIWDVLKDLNPE